MLKLRGAAPIRCKGSAKKKLQWKERQSGPHISTGRSSWSILVTSRKTHAVATMILVATANDRAVKSGKTAPEKVAI